MGPTNLPPPSCPPLYSARAFHRHREKSIARLPWHEAYPGPSIGTPRRSMPLFDFFEKKSIKLSTTESFWMAKVAKISDPRRERRCASRFGLHSILCDAFSTPCTSSSKAMARAVRGEVGTVGVAQATQRGHGVDTEGLMGGCTQMLLKKSKIAR
jgi:hypothetical protein